MYVEVHQTFDIVNSRPRPSPHNSTLAAEPSWAVDPRRVGELMQMHRLNRRLSISALADKVDLSAHALSRIERGEETPTADILERIRRTLQVPP